MSIQDSKPGKTAGKLDNAGSDDAVIPFQVSPLDIRGRAVQLGPLLDSILHRQAYPEAVSKLLAEVITLTVLLGTSLKIDGKFIVQTQTDGPVSLLVVEFSTPHGVRAYARFDQDDLDRAVKAGRADPASLLGTGILAMTIDQGAHTNRYQGIVKLENATLEQVAQQYFRQSEQIPTKVRLAVAQTLTRSQNGTAVHGWRAGGVLVQFLPESSDRMRQKDLHGGDAPSDHEPHFIEEDTAWEEAQALAGTIEDIELTDADIPPQRLLYRLFHEHGVTVFPSAQMRDECSCSDGKIRAVLNSFGAAELAESTIDGAIIVDCEFCGKNYRFSPGEFATSNGGTAG